MCRKYSIDMLRIICAIAVIIIHIVSPLTSNTSIAIDSDFICILELIHSMMNWAVPVFFMITGYCLLKKTDCTYKYCFLHVMKYVAVLFTVGLFYALLEEVFNTKVINLEVIAKAVFNVISGNLWDHMWFVYAIIGIYLVMPVIYCFMQQQAKDVFILIGLLFFFTIICPTIDKWISVGVSFPFGGFLFYVCFGGIVAKYTIEKQIVYMIYFAGALSVLWIVVFSDDHILGYRELPVCLIAMSLFLFFSRKEVQLREQILRISRSTWGIYLIHPLFINVAFKVLHIDLLLSKGFINIILFIIIVFVLSYITIGMFRKIPFVEKLF